MTSAEKAASTPPTRLVFRLQRSAYLAVLFVTIGVTALVQQPWLAFVYLLPFGVAWFIARTATLVDGDGITVRAMFGHTRLPWSRIRGLYLDGHNRVYAETAEGGVRLPCVRMSDLWAISAASGGRLPKIDKPTPKYAPSRRRR